MRRFIGTYPDEPLSAIIPGMVLADLWRFLDRIEMAFRGVSILVVLVGFMSVLIALYMSLNERSQEMAILRSQGFSPYQLTFLLLMESSFLSVVGSALGFILQYGLLFLIRPFMLSSFGIHLPLNPPDLWELVVLAALVGLGIVSGMIPALKAYRESLHRVLY